MEGQDTKICSKCKMTLTLTNFNKLASNKGYYQKCVTCTEAAKNNANKKPSEKRRKKNDEIIITLDTLSASVSKLSLKIKEDKIKPSADVQNMLTETINKINELCSS